MHYIYVPCITLHAQTTLVLVLYSNYHPLSQCFSWTQSMFLMLECISLPHIYVALVQHAYTGKGGEGQEGKFALGPQFVSPKNYMWHHYYSFVFALEANSYGCTQPLVTYVHLMCSFSVNWCGKTRTILAHTVQSSPVAWFDHPTCGCHADLLLTYVL